MNQHLKTIQDLLQQNKQLSEQEKDAVIKAIVDADKQWSITDFKLDRTEKVKKTTAILLEETIAELEQKRKAVEAQNRELEIESALERVRSVAMGMKKPEDMLDVCKTISQQLELLHIKEIRNIQTAIFYEATSIYINYEFYRKHDKLLITEVDYDNHPVAQDFADRMTKGPNHVWTHEFKGEEVRDWLTFQKTTNVFIDSYLEKANSLNYYWYSLGPVALGISTYSPLNEEEINLFKRFRNVFELAYRRYIDIEKAQAQAREAQIEAALERVRSRSMGMQKSDELREVVAVLYEQMEPLGLAKYGCELILCNEQTDQLEFWHANPIQSVMPECYYVSRSVDPICEQQWKAWKEGTSGLIIELKGEKKHAFDNVLLTKTDFKKLPDNIKKWINAEDIIVLSYATMKFGFLEAVDIEALQETKLLVLNRFAKVFEQTYTRFLDLQKAEAQAREAQIQLALERVRARTMAMHHSDQLKDAAALLFQQVKSLGAPAYSCGYNIWEKDDKEFTSWMSTQDGSIINGVPNIPLTEDDNFIRYVESKQNGEQFFVLELRGERMQEHYKYLKTIPAFKAYFDYAVSVGFDLPETQIHHLANFSQGNLLFITLEPCPEFHDVFKRFAAVFEQTYTRFLDLQKAEALAKDAQIEAALERVRARTMAMHSSEDVSFATATMFNELEKLNIQNFRGGILNIRPDQTMEVWSVNTLDDGRIIRAIGDFDMTMHPFWRQLYQGWTNNDESFLFDMSGQDKEDYIRILDARRDYLPNGMPHFPDCIVQSYFFGEGAVWTFSLQPHPEDDKQVMKRFASVFSLTFRRYKDLQKAEAQAREAQIEAALERVRARAMAMHKSDDLKMAVATVFEEMDKLNLGLIRCGIAILDKEQPRGDIWITIKSEQGNTIGVSGDEPLDIHPLLQGAYDAWLRHEDYYYTLENEDLLNYYQAITQSNFQQVISETFDAAKKDSQQYYFNAVFQDGSLFAFLDTAFTDEAKTVMKRFANVFNLTYKRFLDLQKAEAQAREAQIEAALEKVRASAMAMQKSDGLYSVAEILWEQLKKLGQAELESSIVHLYDNDQSTFEAWYAYCPPTHPRGEMVMGFAKVSYTSTEWTREVISKYQSAETEYTISASGEKLIEWYRELEKLAPATIDYDETGAIIVPDLLFYHFSKFSGGALLMISNEEPSQEACDLHKRAAIVFDLAYTRFVDLKNAEAQAREATIEAALEKVRGKAMAMHNSNDLSVTASLVFTELRKLGINPVRCGVSLQTKDTRKNLLYYSIPSAEGDTLSLAGSALLSGHPVLSAIYDSWLRGEDYFPVLKGESLINYYQTLKQVGFDVPVSPSGHEQFGYYLAFSEGMFYGWVEKSLTESEIKILKRFASVIDLTFRRYFELQKSEANAREAIKQAALDRVRAEIASMRTISDLDRITPLIWNELTILGIRFIRCGVFIMDESQQLIHTFLSTPDGNAIAAFHLPYDTPGHFPDLIDHWRNKKIYVNRWNEDDFLGIANTLLQQGAIATKEQYLGTLPKGGFYLHFLPFLQGLLYVGNTDKLGQEEIILIQHVADAFSTAYARYEDFNKLEAAKQQVDKTLVDLKQAQTQLVQSEKMASLGELTAGIAHEIQNPLNFVNNFSDVSNELLEEMKGELATGNMQQAIAIADDVRQNLEKILHHGKRADAIVKGMLQHSRASSGQKEPTDINALADEYLRLAYHGLRAKEKSFNAKFETDFDQSIGKINIIPQEIGRVVLNLINNAFYAVSEKKKTEGETYEPTVTVSTRNHPASADKEAGYVEINVSDNGIGISEVTKDKIFQPFFTTKPSGQGTGLGLSLAYDIITKGHGGDILVKSIPGKGSEFTIKLPAYVSL